MKAALLLLTLFLPLLVSAQTLDPFFERYRNTLDFDDPATVRAIPKFEDELLTLADRKAPLLAGADKAEAHDAAMLMLYAALYMSNTRYAVSSGALPYKDLVRYRRFSRGSTLAEELAARQEKIIQLFQTAAPILRDDQRFPGWLVSSKLNLEILQSGRPSEQSLHELIQTVVDFPDFNLFTFLLIDRTGNRFALSPQEDEQIFSLVEKMTASGGTCKNRVCGNIPKAPYNVPDSLCLLGDKYLQRAEKYLLSGDPGRQKEGYRLAYTALGVYKAAYNDKNRAVTAAWRKKSSLDDRIERANRLITAKESSADYWKTPSAQKVYNCASCHSGPYVH